MRVRIWLQGVRGRRDPGRALRGAGLVEPGAYGDRRDRRRRPGQGRPDRLVARVESDSWRSDPDKAAVRPRALTGYAGEALTRRLFELMARWPDDAREGPYDHPGVALLAEIDPPSPVRPRSIFLLQRCSAISDRVKLARHTKSASRPARDSFPRLHPSGPSSLLLAVPSWRATFNSRCTPGPSDLREVFPLSDRAGESDMVSKPAAGAPRISTCMSIGTMRSAATRTTTPTSRLCVSTWRRSGPARPSRTQRRGWRRRLRDWADESYELARSVVYDKGQFEGSASTSPPPPRRCLPPTKPPGTIWESVARGSRWSSDRRRRSRSAG